jgi:iron complex transport system ATP-binding protein
MIEIKQVHKKYGDLVVLDDVNLTIKDHAVTALIGPNGAGKSTLLGILSKLITEDRWGEYFKNKAQCLCQGDSYLKTNQPNPSKLNR